MNSLCFHAYSIFINIRGDIIGGRRKTAQNTVELHWERILLKIFWTSVNSDSDCICPGKRPNFKKTKTILSLACSPLHLRLDSPCSITFDPRYLYLLRHTINRHSSAKSTCPLAKMFVMNVNACSYKVRQMWLDISTIYWTLDVKKVDYIKNIFEVVIFHVLCIDDVDTTYKGLLSSRLNFQNWQLDTDKSSLLPS